MKTLFIILKVIFNIILFLSYWFVSIFLWSFLYGLILTILDISVPWSQDPVHIRVAVLSVAFTIVVTLLLRKYFYASISLKEVIVEEKWKSKVEEIKEEKIIEESKIEEKEEELEILVNKEIK